MSLVGNDDIVAVEEEVFVGVVRWYY